MLLTACSFSRQKPSKVFEAYDLTVMACVGLNLFLHPVDVYGNSRTLAKSNAYGPHPFYPGTPNLFACVDKSLFAEKRRFMNLALTEDLLEGTGDGMLFYIQTFRDMIMEGAEQDSCGKGSRRDMAEWSKFIPRVD